MKVYVVTSGEYSDYHIDAVFTDYSMAEKYCTTDCDMVIETYEADDIDINADKVYKAVQFRSTPKGRDIYIVKEFYDKKPIKKILNICHYYFGSGGIEGMIPLSPGKEYTKDQLKKIIRDEVAKYNAQEEGL